MNAIGKRRNDLEIMNWIPQIALQIQNSDRSPLYDVRNPASEACEDLHLRSDVMRTTIGQPMVSPSTLFELRRARFDQPARPCHAKPKGAQRGGARRDRTDDLMLAKHALSQLSYGPVPEDECCWFSESGLPSRSARHKVRLRPSGYGETAFARCAREGWWAWEDLNFRP